LTDKLLGEVKSSKVSTGRNGFVKVSKNLARYKSDNFVRLSK